MTAPTTMKELRKILSGWHFRYNGFGYTWPNPKCEIYAQLVNENLSFVIEDDTRILAIAAVYHSAMACEKAHRRREQGGRDE